MQASNAEHLQLTDSKATTELHRAWSGYAQELVPAHLITNSLLFSEQDSIIWLWPRTGLLVIIYSESQVKALSKDQAYTRLVSILCQWPNICLSNVRSHLAYQAFSSIREDRDKKWSCRTRSYHWKSWQRGQTFTHCLLLFIKVYC